MARKALVVSRYLEECGCWFVAFGPSVSYVGSALIQGVSPLQSLGKTVMDDHITDWVQEWKEASGRDDSLGVGRYTWEHRDELEIACRVLVTAEGNAGGEAEGNSGSDLEMFLELPLVTVVMRGDHHLHKLKWALIRCLFRWLRQGVTEPGLVDLFEDPAWKTGGRIVPDDHALAALVADAQAAHYYGTVLPDDTEDWEEQ